MDFYKMRRMAIAKIRTMQEGKVPEDQIIREIGETTGLGAAFVKKVLAGES